jgi:hypothetical protein
MRRTGAPSWIVAAGLLLVGLGASGCSEDAASSPGTGDPSLKVRVNSACDQNMLPVATRDELLSSTMERASVTVSGSDPTRDSFELANGTQVFLYVGKNGKPGGDGGSFVSTVTEDDPTGEPTTADMPLNSSGPADSFFCTEKGTHYLYAGVKKYEPTGKAIIMPASQGFPVRCIDHDTWYCDCQGICGRQDAAVPDASVDAAPPDAERPDVLPPDAERLDASTDARVDMLAPDVERPPSVYRLDFDSPQELAQLQLHVRDLALPGQMTETMLTFKVTENGVERPGIRVEFERLGINDVVLNPRFGISGPDGLVRTLVQAGNTPGQVTVRATAFFPSTDEDEEFQEEVENSPAISISSGLPSLSEFNFVCSPSIFTGFSNRVFDPAGAPPNGDRWLVGIHDGSTCGFALADRLRNRIPAGTPVRFTTEAGSVNAVVAADESGRGTTNLLVTEPPPVDVPPIRYPNLMEPSWTRPGSMVVLNPRDALVRVVASTRGEEGFVDRDGDHQYTEGVDELGPGDDVGEPFVDANDNNAWDALESFDDVDNDGEYDPPNDLWDANTVIWRSTTVLWTGYFNPLLSTFAPQGCEPGTPGCSRDGCRGRECSPVPAGACEDSGAHFSFAVPGPLVFDLRALDDNLNCLDSRDAASIAVTVRSIDPQFGAPVILESNSTSITLPVRSQNCYDTLPEEPYGDAESFTLTLTPPLPDAEDVPLKVDGIITIDVTYQNGLGQPVTERIFRSYCAEMP